MRKDSELGRAILSAARGCGWSIAAIIMIAMHLAVFFVVVWAIVLTVKWVWQG